MFQNISRIHDDLPAIDFPTVSKQAVSKARQFISPDLFKELYYLSVDSFYSQIENRKLWNGYHLYAIDGSKFELPNSKSNFEFWVKCSDTLIIPDDLPWDLLLLYMMYLMITLFMLHLFHHYLASERSAAIEHLKSLETLNIYENSVVIFDRGYYSEKLFSYCVEHGHMCLMRLKETYNIFIIGFMKRLLPKILCTISTIDEINRLYSEAVRNRSQIMPGRTFKRKKNKAKGRTHFNNQKVSF